MRLYSPLRSIRHVGKQNIRSLSIGTFHLPSLPSSRWIRPSLTASTRTRDHVRRSHSQADYEHLPSTGTSPPQKERVVILGSGWGGYTLSRRLDSDKYNPVVISPRSYFVFTPLLTDAASGNLDFSNIVEPIRDRNSPVKFIQAAAREVNFKKKTVLCKSTVVSRGVTESPRSNLDVRIADEDRDPGSSERTADSVGWDQGEKFEVSYDKLIIAVGTITKTFKTPGVRENALFLKDIGDARRVKRRVAECLELALLPTTTPQMREWLLHFAIVGAGPTGTELAASLRDLIITEIPKLYPTLTGIPRISLYDVAPKVLSTFNESLSRYAMDTMRKDGIDIKTSHHVTGLRWGAPGADAPYEMDPNQCLTLTTEEEGEEGVGMCVWATGNATNKFISQGLREIKEFPTASVTMNDGQRPSLDVQKAAWHVKKAGAGPLLVDGKLRVQLESDDGHTAVLDDVFALGDNAMPEPDRPPATAQAARQEAIWLANRLNQGDLEKSPPFSFRSMGTLAYIGCEKALMQAPYSSTSDGAQRKYLPDGLKGRTAWLVWSSAYLTMTISWRNRVRIFSRWVLNRLFGRDISRY